MIEFFKITHPRPIIYAFTDLRLVGFQWADDFDREHGEHASNNDPAIQRCAALRLEFHGDVKRLVHVAENHTDLEINADGLWTILIHHASRKPNKTIASDDIGLFFEKHTNDRNDADWFLEHFVKAMAKRFPEKLHKPNGNRPSRVKSDHNERKPS